MPEISFSITLVICILTAITSFMAFNNRNLLERLMFIPYLVKKDKDYTRFLSGGLIHGGMFHLFINLWVLFMFGTTVERDFQDLFGSMGNLIYIVFYIVALIASGIPSYLKHKDHPHYRALGASGAVSAVLYAYVLMHPLNELFIFPIPIPLPAVVFGLLYLAYEYYGSRKQVSDGIGHDAHFWGAVFGFVFPLLLKPDLLGRFIAQVQGFVGNLIS